MPTFAEEAIKALSTVSALNRNNLAGQEIFYVAAGDMMLQKELNLLFFSSCLLLKSLVDLTAMTDLDLEVGEGRRDANTGELLSVLRGLQ
ncbi:hypothetical protein Tsubulata_026353, partial [Turnera subulata]